MKTLDTFAKRLKAAIDNSPMTQRDLAEYCGIQEGLVSKYLKGKHKPGKKTLLRIACCLDKSPQWLKNNEDSADTAFDISKYSKQEANRFRIEKSPIGGYELTISIKDEELKEIINSVIK